MRGILTTCAGWRRRAGLAAAAMAMAGAGVLAAATPAAAATTPYWGMNCLTGTGGSFGSYYGWASCTGTGVWAVRTSCTAGFTYTSPKVIQIQQTEIAYAGSCYWGVSSVQVVEYSS